MSWIDATADMAAQWAYDWFKNSDGSVPPQAGRDVPFSPMANTPDRVPSSAVDPMQVSSPDGLLKQMALTGADGARPQVPNSPMANAPERYAEADISADETIQGALATLPSEEEDQAVNRKIAMLGLGLKAAGELMQQHMGGGFSVQSGGTGRGYASPEAYQQLQMQKRLAAMHPVDWSKFMGRGLLR